MTASSESLSAVFDSDEFAVEAVYLPPSGSPSLPLRVLVARESEEDMPAGDSFGGRLRRTVKVRAAELAEPVKDGIFETAVERIRIVAAPRRKDRRGLVWTCEGRLETPA